MIPCTRDFPKSFLYHELMKADLRISIKDYRRGKNLKVVLLRVPFSRQQQFFVSMNNQPWPKNRRTVSLTYVMTTLRKALVKATMAPPVAAKTP